ncbi:MAG: hypothetical protein IKQ32_01940 [Prevotella sp.]|nr:hypothetical protein [Prevotella sp.]
MHSSVVNNLTTLLKVGAFGTTSDTNHDKSSHGIIPMSPYKWRVLCKAADKLGVTGYVAMGAEKMGMSDLGLLTFQREYPLVNASLFNHWSDKHLMEVREEEMNAPDTSDETLMLLDTIVANAHEMIADNVSVEGIISLGRMIRQNHDKIDFTKLSSWLSTIGLVQTANLEANILIDFWGMSPDEIPFYVKPYPKASKLYHEAICNALDTGTFSTATRLNIAMTETLSYNFVKAISKITDIEE